MTRQLPALLLAIAATTILASCGAEERNAPAGPPARAVSSAICSPVAYGGAGRPRFLIVNSTGLQGIYRGHGVQTAQAVKLVLAQRGWRAGEYTVGLQVCEEIDARTGQPSAVKCARNAHAFAKNPAVLGVVGPLSSYCATRMLATLNSAPKGPLAAVAGGNTYLGLTRSGPGTAEDEPRKYMPTGRRGYARLAPTDDVQGAANALLARRLGATRAFVVEHDDPYGLGLAAAYRAAADRVGLKVVGGARWNEHARSYRPIGERALASGAETVFVAGDIAADGPRLIAQLTAVLGRGVHVMAGDSFNLPAPIVEAAGSAAEGLRVSIAVLPNHALPPAGRRFTKEFERRFSQRPCCFSVHDAQAAHMLLDAIARSGGQRSRVAELIAHSRVRNGLVGDFSIDGRGDTTLNQIAIYRIRGGRLRFETVISPAPELLGRE